MSDTVSPNRRPGASRGVRAAAKNLGWLLAGRGLIAVLSLAYIGIATRVLTVADFGRFALIAGASQALATLVGFQTWQIVVQYGVDPIRTGDTPRLARLIRACAILDIVSALLGAVLGAAILLLWAKDFGITPDLMRDTLIFLVVQLVTIRSTPTGILRLRDKFSLAALADSTTPMMRFVGAGAALLFLPTVQGFLFAWAAAELATAAAYWIILARTGDLRLLWNARVDRHILLAENPGLIRFALSTGANSSLGLSSKQVPLLLVGGFIGPAAAGVFRLAFQIAQSLAKLSQLLTRAAFPEIVRAVRDKGMTGVPRMLSRMFLASTAAALAILGVVALIGQPLLILIGGNAYSNAYPILLWLAAAGCLDLSSVSFEPVLMAMHRAGTAFAARAVSVILLLVSMFALMPAHGAIGAGVGVFVGSLAAALLLGVAAMRFARLSDAEQRGLP